MEAIFSKLFKDIQEVIKTNVPEIRFTEQNFGQYAAEDFPNAVAFPAALIDFPDTTYSGLKGNIQLGNATISITLLFSPYSQSHSLAPDAIKNKALEYYEIEDKAVKALQGWKSDYCTDLERTNSKSLNRNEIGLRIREINFVTEFEDWGLDQDETKAITFNFTGSLGE